MKKNLEEKNPFTNVRYFPMLFLSLLNPLFSSYHLLSSVVSGKLDVDCLSASFPAFSLLVLLLDGLQLNSPNDRMEINKSIRYFFMFLSLLNPLFSPYHLLSSVVSGKLEIDS